MAMVLWKILLVNVKSSNTMGAKLDLADAREFSDFPNDSASISSCAPTIFEEDLSIFLRLNDPQRRPVDTFLRVGDIRY